MACAALIGLAACGGGSSDGDAARTEGRGGDGAGGKKADADRAGDEPVTISSLLGIGGSRRDIARNVREADRVRQELIRECMERQGFDYVVHVTAGRLENPYGLPTDLSEEEFRRKYGYGIATGFESAMNRPPAAAAPDAAEDPNAAIVAALSPSARAAYEVALHGKPATNGPPQGCEGEAIRATDRTSAVMEEFGDQLEELWARVEADARVVRAEAAWAACMEKAGYRYADEEDIQRDLRRRLNPINDAVIGEDVPEGVIDFAPGKTLTAEQRKMLTELRDFELAVANADQDCRGEIDELRKEVRLEYEARFVNEHRDRLRELFPDGGL